MNRRFVKEALMKRQHGVSIILVVFLLGVVAALVVSVSTLSTTQHFSTLYSARSAQAYFAARAGLDYAISRIVTNNADCGGVDTNLTVEGYTVNIGCIQSPPFNEGNPVSYNVYQLEATASRGSFQTPDITTRRLRATVKNP